MISDPSQSFDVNAGSEMRRGDEEGEDPTIRTDWLEHGQIEKAQVSEESQTLLPDVLLPGMVMGNVQGMRGDLPVVHGTPQPAGVPTVRGTPPGLSSPPHLMQNPQTPPLHLASRAPFPQDVHRLPPNHATEIQSPHQPHTPHTPQPAPHPYPHPHPNPYAHSGRLSHHKEAHEHHAQGHASVSKLLAGSRKLILGTSTKWVIVVVTAILVAVSSGIFAVVALNPSPTLSLLSGSSNVPVGGVLPLHGKGFSPGASILLSLDQGLPLSSTGRSLANKELARVPVGAGLATTALLLSVAQEEQATSSKAAGTTIQASSGGTFDVQIVIQKSWSLGQHTLSAKETNSSRSAELTFNVVARPAKLVANPSTLDFGSLEVGSQVFQSVVIVNAGGQRLNWMADTGGTKWLKVLGSTGAIEPGGPEEFMYVMADTSHLSLGSYTATLTINSNGGKEQVGVKLSVIASVGKQAKLSINPPALDFGQVPVGQQATLGITVSNVGTQVLNWQANTGGTNWLSLDVNAGKINTGQQPQLIQLTVDATGLAPGNLSAMLQFNSNGGIAQVMITLDVSTAAKPPAPILTGSPNGFSVPGDANCSYDVNSGWTCVASLNSYKSAPVNLDWTASSTGVSGVSFTPQSGTLTPGQTAKVTISIPNTACPTGADFTFTGPGNTFDIPWNCAATTLAVSPGAFNANTDCTFSNGWTCYATLISAQNAQGYLNWSASGSGIKGISFSPSSGSLAPGQNEQVTIAVPSVVCPAGANLSFSGQKSNTIAVPWSCIAPGLVISKTNFNANTDCTFNNGWTCNETLSLSSNGPGDPESELVCGEQWHQRDQLLTIKWHSVYGSDDAGDGYGSEHSLSGERKFELRGSEFEYGCSFVELLAGKFTNEQEQLQWQYRLYLRQYKWLDMYGDALLEFQ